MREGRRYYRSTHIRSDRKTIPVPAEGEEDGRYFKCWNCGFICDSKKDASDDGPAGTSSSHATLSADVIPGDPNSAKFRIGKPMVLHELDLLGVRKTVYIERSVSVFSGCPLCGTHNWKG